MQMSCCNQQQTQHSRGGAAMFAYEMWEERHIHPQTCLHFVKCIKQYIKCIGEKLNVKYRSYQASIDPILIPTLISILSILGLIDPYFTACSSDTLLKNICFVLIIMCIAVKSCVLKPYRFALLMYSFLSAHIRSTHTESSCHAAREY